jgi:hypothetical protein
MEKPLLLVDVDGVISLFGFDPARRPAGRFQLVDGIGHFLSATAGQHLRQLADSFELAWCTGWEEKANEYLPFALELPAPLPHLTFDGHEPIVAAHWKLAGIEAYAGPQRPLAWIDDAHDDECRLWAARRGAPTLLIATDPAIGLTEVHVSQLLSWAQRIASNVRLGSRSADRDQRVDRRQ